MYCKHEPQEVGSTNMCVIKTGSLKLRECVFHYFFVAVEERESDENGDNNFEILFHFEVVVVAE